MEAKKTRMEHDEEPDSLDLIIRRALGRLVITQTPYGYRMTGPLTSPSSNLSSAGKGRPAE